MKQNWILLLLIFFFMSEPAASQDRTLKILNYNVLHGLNNDTTKIEAFISWVKDQEPDIIAYQELNDFNLDKLKAMASAYGHQYAVINTGVTHPIGLTSRYPITNVKRDTVTMWHSYLYGNIQGLHIFVTHLSPFEVKLRRDDIDKVISQASLLPQQEKILIAGDFNSLAAMDSVHYDSDLLTAMRRSEGRREPKSGLPIVKGKTIYRNNLDNGFIDYTVTGKVLAAGYKDAYYLVQKTFKHSVPTKGHASKNSKLRRIDYIWVNGAAAQHVVAADIIHDVQTHHLSDHYPVFLEIKHSPKN